MKVTAETMLLGIPAGEYLITAKADSMGNTLMNIHAFQSEQLRYERAGMLKQSQEAAVVVLLLQTTLA